MKSAHLHDAMANEIKVLELNHTWTMMPLPPDKHAIKSKWVYKIKYKSNNSIKRCKARLVTKGYTQAKGLNYHETFAYLAQLVMVVVLLQLLPPRIGFVSA